MKLVNVFIEFDFKVSNKKLGKISYKIGYFCQGGYKDDLKSGLGVY